jgi:thiol-disulfide isomerase/thioredoxin
MSYILIIMIKITYTIEKIYLLANIRMSKNNKSQVDIDVKLYHATWCGHCKVFKPEWEAFESSINNKKIKHRNVGFSADAIESSNVTKNDTVNGQPIEGYPTIKITVSKGGHSEEINYMGKRTAAELTDFMNVLAKRATK